MKNYLRTPVGYFIEWNVSRRNIIGIINEDHNPRTRLLGTIPPPETLFWSKKAFEMYGPLKCARTGRALFDNEAWKQSKNVLKSIHKGLVSDPPGSSFYFCMYCIAVVEEQIL